MKLPGGPIIDNTDISVAADRIGALSKLQQFSVKKVSPSMDSLSICSLVCHPLRWTASSSFEYTALAAIITTGPSAVLPNVPANFVMYARWQLRAIGLEVHTRLA